MIRTISVVYLLLLGFLGTQAYNTSCEGVAEDEIVMFPNPANCSTFFQCVFGIPVEMACSVGLEWNDNLHQCDYPDVAQCEEEEINSSRNFKSSRIYNSCVGIPSSIDMLFPNPDNCDTYIQCVHGQPVVRPCPENLHWSVATNRCEWPAIANCTRNSCANVPDNQDVLLPNPEDCGSYIQCVHQQPVVRPCPPDLHWSVEANRCDWPSNAACTVPSQSKQNYNNCSAVPVDEIVLLPNPNNCSTYIQCTHQRPVVMPCPIGLQWNNSTRQCDSPQNARCRETNTTSNKQNHNNCSTVPVDQIVLLPNPNNCSTYIQCTHQRPIVMPCPIGLHWNNATRRCDYPQNAQCRESLPIRQPNRCQGVPSNVNVLLPNPANCSTYIQCVHGQEMVRPCPAGLHWSVSANRCEWPEIANCRRNSCEGVPETADVLLPNPEDCGTYIQCVHQQPVVRPCPPGLHWNTVAEICDWPQVARCEL